MRICSIFTAQSIYYLEFNLLDSGQTRVAQPASVHA